MPSPIEITIRARPTRSVHLKPLGHHSTLPIISSIDMGEPAQNMSTVKVVSLGMFIIDEFSYLDEGGQPTGRTLPEQVSIEEYVR